MNLFENDGKGAIAMDERMLEETRKKIEQSIEDKNLAEICDILNHLNEVEIAELLDEVDPKTTSILFRSLPKDVAVDVFTRFSSEQQEEIIRSSTDKEVDELMGELYFDDMIDVIEEMPAMIVNKILKASTPDERKLINQFLMYPEDSAGSIMTIEYATVGREMNAKEALLHLKNTGVNMQTIFTSYVTDGTRKLLGTVSLRSLVLADDDAKIEDLMETDVLYVHAGDDREDVAQLFQDYDFVAIPVVDNEMRIIGIITVDDIMDVMEQEATEDFQIMAAMTPSEEKYTDASVFSLAKARVVWLLLLMISATLSASILGHFEDMIAQVTSLTLFIPMLMDTSGNAGSQSSTLVIRGISTGDIKFSDLFRVLWKEFRVAILVGIVLSFFNFIRIMWVHSESMAIAATVSVTLFGAVIIAKLLGGLLPLIAEKLGVDPAVMASPLITTIADASTLLLYFTIAKIFLRF